MGEGLCLALFLESSNHAMRKARTYENAYMGKDQGPQTSGSADLLASTQQQLRNDEGDPSWQQVLSPQMSSHRCCRGEQRGAFPTELYPEYRCTSKIYFCVKPLGMVNFMCQLAWAKGYSENWENMIPVCLRRSFQKRLTSTW